MRTLAIGDIHGCLTALETLLDWVGPSQADLLITLGDYVDRGPDSRGVIDRLLHLKTQDHLNLVPLRGNHEVMMLEARHNMPARGWWLVMGGDATLESYAQPGPSGRFDVPEAHWEFIEHGCVNTYETTTHFFVHANVDPDLPLDEQTDAMLFWERFGDPVPHVSGKIMVCGHTSQKSGVPRNVGHAICIDTWVYGNGWLTCLDIETGLVWQTNQAGERRGAWIDDFAE